MKSSRRALEQSFLEKPFTIQIKKHKYVSVSSNECTSAEGVSSIRSITSVEHYHPSERALIRTQQGVLLFNYIIFSQNLVTARKLSLYRVLA